MDELKNKNQCDIHDVMHSIQERIINHEKNIKYYEDYINSCKDDKNLTPAHFDLCKKYIQNIELSQNLIKECKVVCELWRNYIKN